MGEPRVEGLVDEEPEVQYDLVSNPVVEEEVDVSQTPVDGPVVPTPSLSLIVGPTPRVTHVLDSSLDIFLLEYQ